MDRNSVPTISGGEPLAIVGIATLVQRFDQGVECNLPFRRAPQHQLNVPHGRRRVASAQVLRGRNLSIHPAHSRRQTVPVDGLGYQRPRHCPELRPNLWSSGLRCCWQANACRNQPSECRASPATGPPHSARRGGISGSETAGGYRKGNALWRGRISHGATNGSPGDAMKRGP